MENNSLQETGLGPEGFPEPEKPVKKSGAKPFIIAGCIVAGVALAGATAWVVVDRMNNTTSGETTSVGSNNKITKGGTYTFTGEIPGRIIIDTTDEVKIILQDVTITNTEASAAIKSKNSNKVYVTLEGTNKITSAGDGFNVEGDLEISGSGSLTIESDDDGIHADSKLTINGGTYTITAHEGLEATYIIINDGTITINASDDGINAAQKVDTYTPMIEINGGTITIKMGSGDTDGLDSNGNIYINGGTVDITGQNAIDYDGEAKLNGGKLIVNGTQMTTITNQFMNGGGMMPGGQMPSGTSGQMPTDGSGQQMQNRTQGNGGMRTRGTM